MDAEKTATLCRELLVKIEHIRGQLWDVVREIDTLVDAIAPGAAIPDDTFRKIARVESRAKNVRL